ncbi:hypothetical protein NC653_030399 [Populus alba x Populus x berolinensis]|uniref:Uncharacterized protein n=1 Tax=Populus alba x Populus x berolinensis TaxID=444605 RepID=A0AAD6Q212_9ROSI|nr:hypothetical protein NC653_030399 [Populus alba x Populus x berolinensis]
MKISSHAVIFTPKLENCTNREDLEASHGYWEDDLKFHCTKVVRGDGMYCFPAKAYFLTNAVVCMSTQVYEVITSLMLSFFTQLYGDG